MNTLNTFKVNLYIALLETDHNMLSEADTDLLFLLAKDKYIQELLAIGAQKIIDSKKDEKKYALSDNGNTSDSKPEDGGSNPPGHAN